MRKVVAVVLFAIAGACLLIFAILCLVAGVLTLRDGQAR
jgi:hypothetical protein